MIVTLILCDMEKLKGNLFESLWLYLYMKYACYLGFKSQSWFGQIECDWCDLNDGCSMVSDKKNFGVVIQIVIIDFFFLSETLWLRLQNTWACEIDFGG